MYYSVQANDTKSFDELIKAGGNIQKTYGQHCQSLLHTAASNANTKILKKLFSHNISVDIKDNMGCNSLMAALREGKCEVVQMLLHNKASVDLQANNGDSPLMLAAQK